MNKTKFDLVEETAVSLANKKHALMVKSKLAEIKVAKTVVKNLEREYENLRGLINRMSVSTDGLIFYGVLLDEDTELPWNTNKYDYSELEWWRDVNGFKPTNNLYDENGNWVNGIKPTEEAYKAYYTELALFDKKHPIPFEVVNYCSGEYPLYALTARGSYMYGLRGDPTEINPSIDFILDNEKVKVFVDFCIKYFDLTDVKPRWWLGSYWG